MSNKSYNDLLLSRKWKKKSYEIMKRDHFQCTACGSKKGIQVHHTFYYDNFMAPWLYPDKSLITVCGDCHKKYHEFKEHEIRHFVEQPKKKHKKCIKKHNQDKAKMIPERHLTKVRTGRGYVYELKTIWIKKTA